MNCPAEGCDYTNPTRKGMLGHLTGKRDAAHKGGWKEWDDKLEGEGVEGSAAKPTETPTETTETSGGSNPAMGAPSPQGRKSASSDGGKTELPCGHETFDESNAPEPPYRVSCGECGQSWRVTADE